MSEKEKATLATIKDSFKKLSKEGQNFLAGYAAGMACNKEEEAEKCEG